MERVNYFEAEEIAALMLEIDEDAIEQDDSIVEEKLAEEFNVSMEDFHRIVQFLFEKVDLGISPLTNTPMIGFGTGSTWLAKKEINSRFISAMIQFLSDGTTVKAGTGYITNVTNDGELEYGLSIEKPNKDGKFLNEIRKERIVELETKLKNLGHEI